ncbi:MAG: EamA family transporter [Candidatus Bathyarchaeota archaeon]|jgi:transporter family protein|nr:EamA family transporter [Candidatus Bathyarchaeota archaeon]MDH5419406.1 EamA family transporter [Candidatus Bathyarchaeota archaeon]MDH5623780.1 EamA family transporter [Candidatus Bathyarchaeota archaeon]MDH5635692.1 EamA family transporter [Candidatus Bathyarchaeota archaeon]
MEWFLLAALSAFFAALVSIFAKIGLQGVDSTVGTAARAIVMVLFIVVFVISSGKGPQLTQFTSKDMGFIILSGIAGALSWLFYFAALKLADASKVAPVDRASVLIVMVLAALFLGEKVTLKTATAGVLIFAGLLLLAVKLD